MFLRTLAEEHCGRAVGAILSGAGSDGAVGIFRIKQKGGITVAQAPDDAEYGSMPRSATHIVKQVAFDKFIVTACRLVG